MNIKRADRSPVSYTHLDVYKRQGRIYLTNQRLIFESHTFNIQTGFTIVSINNIDSMETVSYTHLLIIDGNVLFCDRKQVFQRVYGCHNGFLKLTWIGMNLGFHIF